MRDLIALECTGNRMKIAIRGRNLPIKIFGEIACNDAIKIKVEFNLYNLSRRFQKNSVLETSAQATARPKFEFPVFAVL
jgi:uncharacterized protein YpiB (UPF0302 family)